MTTTRTTTTLLLTLMTIASAVAEGPKPAVLVGSETSADMASFRARLASGPGFGDFIAGSELPGAAYALAAPTSLRDKSTRKPPWMKARSIHWSPYDRVRVVNADP